jgi:hypothetical protein
MGDEVVTWPTTLEGVGRQDLLGLCLQAFAKPVGGCCCTLTLMELVWLQSDCQLGSDASLTFLALTSHPNAAQSCLLLDTAATITLAKTGHLECLQRVAEPYLGRL